MTDKIDTKTKRHLPGTFAAGLAIAALLALGTFVAPASAEEHHGSRPGGHGAHHPGGGHRGGYGGGNGGWSGGYYGAPPVVYGGPYYEPPPVVYGPGIGISLPSIGISIN